MPILKDYKCKECAYVFEIVAGEDTKCQMCDSVNTERVFPRGTIQFRTKHASVVDHVINMNSEKMREVEEEDATPGSDYQKAAKKLSYDAEIIGESYDYDD